MTRCSYPGSFLKYAAIRLHQEPMSLERLHLSRQAGIGASQFDPSLHISRSFGRQVPFVSRNVQHGRVFHADIDRDIVAVAEVGESGETGVISTATECDFVLRRQEVRIDEPPPVT